MRRRRRERLVELLCSYECRRRGALEQLIYSRGTLASMWAPVPSAARLAKRCHSFKRQLPRNRTMF